MPSAPTATATSAGRILFVDDDPRLLDGIRRRLRGRFQVETAIGPEQGLEVLAAQPPLLVRLTLPLAGAPAVASPVALFALCGPPGW